MATEAWRQYVPEGWGVEGGAYDDPTEKINWLNQQRVGTDILSNLGIAQGEIDWMLQHGYAGKYDAPTGIAGLAPAPASAAPVDYFQAQPDYTYQDLIADTTAAPAAPAPLPTPQEMAAKIGKVLPTEWGVAGGAYDEAQEKGRYFQQQGITSQQLRDAGADPGDIAWLESQGYISAAPSVAATPAATTPQQNDFYNYLYQGNADAALATQRGIEYAREQGWTPQQAVDEWNKAHGTQATLADYYRVTGLTPEEAQVSSIEKPTFSNFGDQSQWDFGSNAIYDPQTAMIRSEGNLFQRGNEAVVSDELFWNPHSASGAELQQRVKDAQDQGQRAGVVITPYAVFQGKTTDEQLLNEIANSNVDFVGIDPYLLGMGVSSDDLYKWAKEFIPKARALGKEVKLVTQGFAVKGLEQQTLEHNQKLLALPGVSEFINFGREDAKDLLNDPNIVSINNDFINTPPTARPTSASRGATPQAAAATTTAGADSLPDYSNMVNPFTGETFGSMDPASLVQAEVEQKTFKNLTDQLLAGWQGLGENVGIGSAGTPDAEIGGRKLQFVAEDFAKKLQQQGITDLSQAKFDPGAQAAWTAEGHGNVSLMATSDGRLVPVWGSSSDAGKARQLALAIGAALVAPGLSTALGGGIAGGAGAGAILGGTQAAISGGDILKGALTGGLTGGIGAGAAPFAQSIGADVLASTGSQVLADAATAAVRAGAGALPRAITTGEFGNVLTAALTAGATSGATSGVSQITGLSTKDINAAINFAQGAASGDLSKMLSSASAFTNNPDIEVASKAVRLVQAIESGDPSRIVSAGQAFGRELDGYNTRQTIENAYQDPTRILDTITGNKLRDAGLKTTAGSEDLTTQDLIDIINPPGQVATAAPAVQTTPPTTAAATTTTTTAPTQGPYDKYVDFGEAFRAARSELGSGKQFTWTNPVTGATQTYTTDLAPTQVAQVTAGGGRGIAPGATAADAAALSKISLRQEPAASTAQTATVADEPIYDALGNLVGGSTISGEAPAWFDPANKVLSNVVQQGFSNLMQAAGGQAKDFGGAAAALGIAGPDNALIRAGSAMEKAGEGIELQSVKQATQNVITAVRDADGYGEKIIAGVKAIIDNPSSANVAAREVFQEILPIGAASRVAKTAGLLAAAGVDTALNAAESMGSSYNDSYAKAIKDGKTPEQADAQATKDGFIAGAITTLVGGAVDLAVVKKLSNVVEKVTGKVATSSGKEFGSEGAEEFLIAIATGDDLNTALTKSVIGSFVGAKTTADVDVASHIDAALNTELKNAGLNITTDANGKVSITDTGKPSSDVRTEPSFDQTYVVATDPDTGDAITLGELTGSTLSSAGTSTRIDPTLEALEGTELDSQQIINDYINEVLGGNAPSVSTSTANVVVGTDPETGADVTLGDLGLTGPTTKAPVTTGVTAPATTAPSTTTAPDTAIASDTSVAAAPAATVGTDTKTTTDPNTGVTTTTATDPNTGTETTTKTDPNTGTETNTATDPNTGSTTTTQTDPNANTSTTTKTDPNTNTSTSTTTDANTNTSTTTTTDANTNTTSSVETNQNTGVTTNTSTTPDTNTTTTTDPNTNTTTTSDTNNQTGVTTQTVVDANTNTSTTTKTDPNTNTSTTTESNPNTGTDTTTTTDPNTNTTTTTETNTNTGTSTTTTVDTTTGEVVDTNVEVPPVLPPGEDVLPPVTEEELKTIVAGPPPAPTPPPPAPTLAPAPRTTAPATKAPTPSPSPAAQLAQIPGMTPQLANFIQELMRTDEADLLQFTTALKEEREKKRKDVRDKLKSRKV